MFSNGANTFLPISPVIPPFLIITAITNSYPMVVTVSTSNNYVVDQVAHFTIPESYGMIQLDQKSGQIIGVNVTNLIFQVDIDSTYFDVFTVPGAGINIERPATLSPGGSRNLYNFQQVPFHSEGNFGN